MSETLVIVHLSSIDSYVDFYGIEPAQKMVNDIRFAIATHIGPVIVMDQGWQEISEDAKLLRQMVLDLQVVYPQRVTVFHHDEWCDISPWQDGMKNLAKILRKLKTNRVRLGGFWTSETATSGCVHEVQRQLRARNRPCYIEKEICALEENDKRTLSADGETNDRR